MADPIPAHVAEIAKQIADEPLSWREHENGTITIVFANKGKRTFDKPLPVVKTQTAKKINSPSG